MKKRLFALLLSILLIPFTDCTSLTNMTFTGTTAEWTEVKKEVGWNHGTGFSIVHCSDGDVAV